MTNIYSQIIIIVSLYMHHICFVFFTHSYTHTKIPTKTQSSTTQALFEGIKQYMIKDLKLFIKASHMLEVFSKLC